MDTKPAGVTLSPAERRARYFAAGSDESAAPSARLEPLEGEVVQIMMRVPLPSVDDPQGFQRYLGEQSWEQRFRSALHVRDYPLLFRITRGRLTLPDITDPRARLWAVGRDPEAIHRVVLGCLPLRPPESRDRILARVGRQLTLDAALALLEQMTISRPLPLGKALAALAETQGALRYGQRRGTTPEQKKELVNHALKDMESRWECWCGAAMGRDRQFLQEYQDVLTGLQRKPSLKDAFASRVSPGALLQLGSFSVLLRPDWKTRCRGLTSSKAWTEFLLAERDGTHRWQIRERRARARREQLIAAAWAQYGAWLRQEPKRVREIEAQLGGIQIKMRAPDYRAEPIA